MSETAIRLDPHGIRLAHLSDVHVSSLSLGWGPSDWLSKRVTGWINLNLMGRKRRFLKAEKVLAAIMAELRQRRPDCIVFSGDATALGFEKELRTAAEIMGLEDEDMPAGLAVPGNHDYYTRRVAGSGMFEKHFAAWLVGERLDDAVYPFARRVGPLWLIGVNSCTGNVLPWDAGGSVGPAQRQRLHRLLAKLDPGPRILVTHYPVRRAGGLPEDRRHRLRDVAELIEVAADGGVCLWLHGHRHDAYFLNDARIAPFPVICAGSATQEKYWGYNEYTIIGRRLHGSRRVFDPDRGTLMDGESFELELAIPVETE